MLKILGILFISITLYSCDQKQDTESGKLVLRPVRTLTIDTGNSGIWREFPGVVDASRKADLTFRVPGKLKEILVKESDQVKKDQALATLDQTDYQIQLNSRKAEYEKTSADFNRAKDLIKQGHISRSDFDKLKSANIAAKANLDAAEQNLAYTTLRAPFTGRIAKRYVENYEEVGTQQTIFSIQDVSSLTVKIDVPESIMIRIRKDASRTAMAVFEAIPDKEFPLTFKEVSTQPDQDSKTYQVSFSMPVIDEYNILPGMSVTVRGRKVTEQDVVDIYLPAHAVLQDQQGHFVYKLEPNKDNTGTIRRQPVSIGELTSQGILVKSGLNELDQVVIAGMSKMSDGLIVRVMEESAQ